VSESWRQNLYRVIFEAETPLGKAFDVGLLWAILASVLVVVLDSMESFNQGEHRTLLYLEWGFTALFTIEYVLRLITAPHPVRYARSFFGLIDLAAIVPTYLTLLFPGVQSLLVIRVLRLLRVFRVFKLARYMGELQVLVEALRASRRKVAVVVGGALCIVTIIGAIMYLVEGPESGFTSIPRSMYWAIVTMTTVGYGDISPQTPVGQFLASLVMLMGYSLIAVPTGIVSVELAEATRRTGNTVTSPTCLHEGHAPDAIYCRRCASVLDPDSELRDQS
jgi:voltage-gated potassium channel